MRERVHMGSRTTPRVAVIGSGWMARMHAAGWERAGISVLAYSPNNTARLASQFRNVIACSSMDQALAEAQIVDLCTPTDTHAALVTQAFEAGRDVICEKPLTRNLEDAQRLAAQALDRGLKLMPAHVVRWFSDYDAAHRSVLAADLGTISTGRYTRTGMRPDPAWYHDLRRSGGIILDLMIHDLDQALWNFGPVSCVRSCSLPPTPTRVEGMQVTMEHCNGIISSIEGTWGPQGTMFHTTFELTGSEGVFDHDSRSHRQGRIDERDTQSTRDGPPHVVSANPYHQMLADFLAWHLGGPPPPVTVADGVAAVRLGNLAIEAYQRGTEVSAV